MVVVGIATVAAASRAPLLGSVSQRVVHLATCPVVVVR